MVNWVKVTASAVLVTLLSVSGVLAAGKRAPAAAVAGEEDFRSATGYTVVLMEHCKAINKLSKAKGAFNAELAREHAGEISRSAAAASRHMRGYLSALGADQRVLVSAQSGAQEAGESAMVRFAGELDASLKGASPDRKAVTDAVTNLYLAAKDLLTSHRAAGKALGISAAPPPRKAVPRKPKAVPETARVSTGASD